MLCTIIGAGPGLGAGLARRFADGGFDVALVARSRDSMHRWRSGQDDPDRFEIFTADAASAVDLAMAFAAIHRWRGDTDVLIYNAADMTPDSVGEVTVDGLHSALATTVDGALTSAQLVLPAMRRRGRGTVLFTGGGLALEPYPDWASLSAGKAALRSLAINLHKQLLPQGIHVAIIAVCGIVTPDGPFAPHIVADQYWRLHQQPLTQADRELIYLPEGSDPYYNDPDAEFRGTSEPITRRE